MFKRILVATDGSSTASKGLRTAIELAADQQAVLHIVHVIDDMTVMPTFEGGYIAPDYVDSVVQALRESGQKVLAGAEAQARARGVVAKSVMADARGRSVADTLLAQAKRLRADLIVLGTHGRRGLRRVLLGSDAETIVREARVPVLLVRLAARSARPAGVKTTRKTATKAKPAAKR
jgi:nucleotide-binding universal stress UspA family protein